MTRFLLALILFCSSIDFHAQATKGDLMFGPKAGYLQVDGFAPRNYGGVELELMIDDRASIHWSILAGEKYFHMPLGPVAGIFAGIWAGTRPGLQDSTRAVPGLGIGIVAFILTAAIPEGISYHVPITEKMTLAPYVSPLQFEFLRKPKETDSFAGGAIGLKWNCFFPTSTSYVKVSPYAEYKVHYGEQLHPGFSAGLGLSFSVTKEKSEQ